MEEAAQEGNIIEEIHIHEDLTEGPHDVVAETVESIQKMTAQTGTEDGLNLLDLHFSKHFPL